MKSIVELKQIDLCIRIVMISGAKEKKNTPRKKEKFQIAKNPGQLVLGVVLFSVMILNGIYMIYKAHQPEGAVATQTESTIAQNQQEGLESLSQDPTGANVQADANDIYNQTVGLQGGNPTQPKSADAIGGPKGMPGAPAIGGPKGTVGQLPGDDVDIMSSKNPRKRSGKTIMVSISEGGRSNPFLPEGDMPSIGQLNITYPPEQLAKDSDASKVMDTTISGILFDKYSPSAIINISKTDYLVRKGDVINNYKVLAILKDQVVVKLGKNVYRAGVGELLQQDKVNYNTVANLEKKFGGNNVSIGVKKRGY